MILQLCALSALLTTTLLAGLHLGGLVGLNPAMRSLESAPYVVVKKAADREFPKIAKPLMLSSLLLTAGFAVAAALGGYLPAAMVAGVAALSLVGTLLAILRGDLPLNREMANWTPTAVPLDWVSTRQRWERYFAWRGAANILAVVLLVVAGLLVR